MEDKEDNNEVKEHKTPVYIYEHDDEIINKYIENIWKDITTYWRKMIWVVIINRQIVNSVGNLWRKQRRNTTSRALWNIVRKIYLNKKE